MTEMIRPFRLLIIDDHPVVLFGLRLLFKDHPHFVIVEEAANAPSARDLMEAHKPDFVVSDLIMGERDGTELVEDLLAIHPSAQVLIYSSLEETRFVREALAAGARGYLGKTEGLECVVAALDRIMAGDVALSPSVQMGLIKAVAQQDRTRTGLSHRERQVLKRIGRNEGLQDIAQVLGLSIKTVGTYRERLKVKLGLDNLRELECFARDYRTHARE